MLNRVDRNLTENGGELLLSWRQVSRTQAGSEKRGRALTSNGFFVRKGEELLALEAREVDGLEMGDVEDVVGAGGANEDDAQKDLAVEEGVWRDEGGKRSARGSVRRLNSAKKPLEEDGGWRGGGGGV